MVWALTRVVIHSDDESSQLFTDGAEFSLSEGPDTVRAGPFTDDELEFVNDELDWLEFPQPFAP